MKDPIEFKGFWWLPDDADKKLPGTLIFSQNDGTFLDIVGLFGKDQTKRIEQPDIILGNTQQGKPVTLFNCFCTNWTYPIGGLGGGKYKARFVFEGVHFSSIEDIKFYKLCGSYTDLDAWVDIYGFVFNEEIAKDRIAINVNFELPGTKVYEIDEKTEVGISFSIQGPKISTIQTETTISQSAFLFVKSKGEDINFEILLKQLNKFSFLLQLAVQRMIYPLIVSGFSSENAQNREGNPPFHPEINIYYEPIEALRNLKPKLPNEMLFTFKDLDANQIKNWFDLFNKYQTVIHLYRSNFYQDQLFIDTKFLNIAQALESLHSILFDNQYFPHDEFVDRKEKVLQVVPYELQEWVKDALSNANYKRFSLKILELFEKKIDFFPECIDDLELFVKKITGTRNKFVHHNKQKWTFQMGNELVSAINLMTMLFESYILELIGFSDEKIQELLEPKIQSHLTGWKHLRSRKN